MKHGVYQILNLINGKRYIGSAASHYGFDKRWTNHRSRLNRNLHHSPHLQNAWNKYSADSFAFEVLLYCDPKDCIMYEQMALDCYKPEYNVCLVAGSTLGRSLSTAHKAKIRQSMIGKECAQDTRRKISLSHHGKHNGENGNNSKLTSEQVAQIRAMLSEGIYQSKIASRFMISQATVSAIKLGTRWGNI